LKNISEKIIAYPFTIILSGSCAYLIGLSLDQNRYISHENAKY